MNKLRFWLLVLALSAVGMMIKAVGLKVTGNHLEYSADSRGNQFPDFSYCGYDFSNTDLPLAVARVFVPHQEGDATAAIQKAIDYVSALKPDADGLRGAVLLDSGIFQVSKTLDITNSGVVLRGKSVGGTVLLRTGIDRAPVLRIQGVNNRVVMRTLVIKPVYHPSGNSCIELEEAALLQPGARVLVHRPSTKEWIASLGCDVFGGGIGALGWKPGEIDLWWDRIVEREQGNKLCLNVPITMPLDPLYGSSQVVVYQWPGRISKSGVENLTMVSDYDRRYPRDEDHAWTGVSVENAEHCWVSNVRFRHFAGSAVILQPTASSITVEDCVVTEPVSEIGGLRRISFYNLGQLNLFQRCYAEDAIHAFAVGFTAPGPNAFVQCHAENALGFSGSVDSWAPGVLFDIVNIDGNKLIFKNLYQARNGAGWNTANSVFWQCTASEIACFSPSYDSPNRAYGCWAQFSGDGYWESSNSHIQPRSLFYAQLQQRLRKEVDGRARILPLSTNASTSPTIAAAQQHTREALVPLLTLYQWILSAPERNKPSAAIIPDVNRLSSPRGVAAKSSSHPVSYGVTLESGRLLFGKSLIIGKRMDVPWWSGKLRTPALEKARPHITRFVPGREGNGLTDVVEEVVAQMVTEHVAALDHNYGLWYDRRRDDHQRVRRHDGDVWGPFYEQPFARSGEGQAWDGLSRYDLSRPNLWYWHRLRSFATLADKSGKLLYHQHFFQHNILEAGAHWVDAPWRTANSVQDLGFPEPVLFAGDKRIFYAEMFYDITNEERREAYRQYIRQGLENFAEMKNVIHMISAEYTGPLHFVEFWLDEIAAWQAETGKSAVVGLSTTFDVQEAILLQPHYNKMIDVIDIRYWHEKQDGELYAPSGGMHLAPRQHARLERVGKVDFQSVYNMVRSYRDRYPNKAVLYHGPDFPAMGWAVLMAGGSCPAIPATDPLLLEQLSKAEFYDLPDGVKAQMVKTDKGGVIFSHQPQKVELMLGRGKYVVKQINMQTGTIESQKTINHRGDGYVLEVGAGIYWWQKL